VVSAVTGIITKNYENTENMEIKPVWVWHGEVGWDVAWRVIVRGTHSNKAEHDSI
jgi:hypothetical protein